MARPLYAPVLHGATCGRADEIDTIRAAVAVHSALRARGFDSAVIRTDAGLDALRNFDARRPDVVFNLVEALDGRSAAAAMAIRAIETRGLAVTGASADAYRRASDKLVAKAELAAAGLPTPAWSADGLGLSGPVIVKSVAEHASLGIDAGSVMAADLAPAAIARRAVEFGDAFFAEAYVDGREFNISVLDGAVLPPAEIEFVGFAPDVPRIVDWNAKWVEDSAAYANTPRRFAFPEEDSCLLAVLTRLAERAADLFDLNGYARVDFRVDAKGQPWILEVNANPCLTPDAGFAAAAMEAGLDYDTLVERIACAAVRGHRRRAAA